MIKFHHIAQMKHKVVRIKPDAIEIYDADPFWATEAEQSHAVGQILLQACIGKECPVMGVTYWRNRLFYKLPIDPMVTIENPAGPPLTFDNSFFPADYMEIIEHGFWMAE